MKNHLISLLQKIFGYELYLELFSVLKIHTLFLDRRKSDYRYFLKLTEEKENVIIIGACTGITTVPIAKIPARKRVIAYEPIQTNYHVLNKIIQRFELRNVESFQIALGNNKEQRAMILPILSGAKKQGLAHIHDSNIQGFSSGISEHITVDKIDNRSELVHMRIDAMKIVAENYEYQILLGAEKTIHKNRPWIYCELWDNENRKLVLDLMFKYNYRIYCRRNKRTVKLEQYDYTGRYYFFIPEEFPIQ